MSAFNRAQAKSGNLFIDGLLYESGSNSGTVVKWSDPQLTFSFPTNSSFYYKDGLGHAISYRDIGPNLAGTFVAFNDDQKAAVRAAFDMFASIANIRFTKVDETNTTHANIRFGFCDRSDTDGNVFGATVLGTNSRDEFYPIFRSRDVLANEISMNPWGIPGTLEFENLLHEIGHSVGLDHVKYPINNNFQYLYDSQDFTVMSYNQFRGATWVVQPGDYPQSLMMNDIRALQYLYGANFNTNGGNTTYKWDPNSGTETVSENGRTYSVASVNNKVRTTVWDGGGNDTYDFSDYRTNLSINLEPGTWCLTSADQLVSLQLGDRTFEAVGNIANAYLYNGDTHSLIENAIGGSGNDTITGNQADNALTGNGGNDSLGGGAGNDTLDGGNGNDTLDGGVGNDRLVGGIGNDSLIGGDGNDTLNGDAGNDTLDGGIGNDSLIGGDGNDALNGGAGNDTLDGGAGGDKLIGGAGDDVYLVDFSLDLVFEAVGEGTDTVYSTVAYTLGQNVENLTLTGSARRGGGNALDNVITGNNAGDSLFGYDGNDRLMGGTFADTLDGGSGVDSLIGGYGNDVYYVDSSSDQVVEASGQGTDTVYSTVDYTLSQNVENLTLTGSARRGGGNALDNVITGNNLGDSLFGNDGNDTLSGGAGIDTLDGGNGDDRLIGGAGDDVYYVDSSSDQVVEASGQGTDTVYSTVDYTLGQNVENLTLTGAAHTGTGNTLNNVITGNNLGDRLFGVDGNDTLSGGVGNDTLDGGNGDDKLDGGAGDDRLYGGAGNDTLEGGTGTDFLSGGAGADIFVFRSVNASLPNSIVNGARLDVRDTIADFEVGQDKIDFSVIDADTTRVNDQAFHFIGEGGFTKQQVGELRYVRSTGVLSGDINGDGEADFEVCLVNKAALTAGDFIL